MSMARALKDTNRLDEDPCSLGKLKEILCPDTEDLDDPIYKIIKYKNEKINDFLDKQLSDEIDKDIYRHLIKFFSRYFRNGMISINRYFLLHDEDVCFHWSNKDQYYVKSMEYLKKYGFKVKDLNVNFRIVKAQLEKGNSKPNEKKFFVLNDKIFDFDEDKKELNIYFDYRALTDEEKEKFKSKSQTKINKEIVKVLDEKIPKNSLARLIFEKEGNKTIIEKHINKYTKRKVIDYFIHKDLKGFLERELDFYIKNEFLQLEDLDILNKEDYFDRLRTYLNAVKVFRNIASKIIDFLSQIENFQKKIWEKKKFVINTHYVITLDKIKEYAGEKFLESILDEILSNEKQLEEWKELFGIEVKNKNDLIERNTLDGKEWKKLPIDTKYFGEEFKWKLLSALSKNNDLDEILDGILIKSENWQALNLLLNKYYEKVQTIYIDPPYNTGNDGFLYKDNYRHSSWLTMMENRLRLAKELMRKEGAIFISIDDNELYNLKNMSDLLGFNFISNIIWKSKSGGAGDASIAIDTEYILFLAIDKNKVIINKKPIERKYQYKDNKFEEWGRYAIRRLDETGIRYSKTLDFPIVIDFTRNIILVDDIEIPIKEYMFLNLTPTKEDKKITLLPGGCKNHLKKYTWRWKKEKIADGLLKGYLVFSQTRNGKIKLFQKIYERFDTTNERKKEIDTTPYRNWYEETNTGYGKIELSSLFGFDIYPSYIKNTELIKFLLKINTSNLSIILDYFAGSGTTAHAVMKLNKEDGGKRKFILVEMADYFDTVIIPRIKKVAYSFNWKNGKPQDTDGIGVFFKYHTLEQYEDALVNIEFENKNSKTLPNIDEMKDPFNYKLKIIENYQQKIVNVDLIETFNYLLGIHVQGYKVLNENNRKYVFVFGKKYGKKIAIVWRSIKEIDFEKDKEVIEREIKEFCPDEIYINGDSLVKGFKAIEPMF